MDNHDHPSGVLQCRVCRDGYTYQSTVEVFSCDEDGGGVRASIGDGVVTVNSYMKNNPSPRRQGIRIYFYCESCHADSHKGEIPPPYELLIYQHKGQTCYETVYYIEDES